MHQRPSGYKKEHFLDLFAMLKPRPPGSAASAQHRRPQGLPLCKRPDLSLSLLPHLKLGANRSGLRSPSAFSPVDFKAFLKVDIHYLPISTVDPSLEI